MGVTLLERLRDSWRTLRRKASRDNLFPTDDPTLSGLSGIISHRGTPPLRHVEDLLIAYSRLPWLRAVVGKIGFSTGSIPWQLFVETPGGVGPPTRSRAIQRAGYPVRKKMIHRKAVAGDLVEITDHRLLDLLDQFNPLMTGLAARKLTQVHLDLVGEAFWLKQRDALGVTIGLWPLPPPWIRETPSPRNPYYVIQFQSWTVQVEPHDMVWFLDLDPSRPYWRGKGTAESLGDELETDEYAAKHTKTEFYNHAVPETLVTAEGMGESETRRLETDWRQRNQGFFKALQVYFINRKVDVKQLGQNFKNLQLIQLREFERNMIIQVFGVPPEILGIIEKSNRATIDAADFLFSRWVLTPRLELQREVMQKALISEFDERLILDYESPVEEDAERQMKAASLAPWALTVDEWRARQGEEPLAGEQGQVHMVPQNLVPVTSLAGGGAPTGPEGVPAPQPPLARQLVGKKPRLVYDKDALERVEDALDASFESR